MSSLFKCGEYVKGGGDSGLGCGDVIVDVYVTIQDPEGKMCYLCNACHYGAAPPSSSKKVIRSKE